jgi:hypothetical protein
LRRVPDTPPLQRKFLDIGLAQTVLELDLAEWILKPETCLVNRGAIAEAFVGQELLAYFNPAAYKANFPTINLRKSKVLSDLSDNRRKSCIIPKQ